MRPTKKYKSNRTTQRVKYSSSKKSGGFILPMVAVVTLSVAVSGVWQLLDKGKYVPPSHGTQISSEISSSSSISQGESSQSTSQSSSNSSSSIEVKTQNFGRVQKGEWVRNTYFNDAVFLGDSITDGIKLYDIMSNTTVLSNTGIGLGNIFTKKVNILGTEQTLMEALATTNAKKVYVLMGANSMGSDLETFIKSYGVLIDGVKKAAPNAIIYIQSVLPVTQTYAKLRPTFANERIDEFNVALEKLCEEKQVYYLYVAEVLKDENGGLFENYSSDGLHFGPTLYREWFSYLHEHTVATA